jgi:hypothetical protein
MGKARKVTVGTLVFETAKDAKAFFSGMLNKYSIGSKVTDKDSGHLTALLDRHDEKLEKIGVGINHFEVDTAPVRWGGKCFWIVRSDESREDFSFQHCLERKSYD